MRTLVLAAALAAVPVVGLTAPPAAAECDPKYWPRCTNDCQQRPPSLRDPLEYFTRVCPD